MTRMYSRHKTRAPTPTGTVGGSWNGSKKTKWHDHDRLQHTVTPTLTQPRDTQDHMCWCEDTTRLMGQHRCQHTTGHRGSGGMAKVGFYSSSHSDRFPAVNAATRRGTVAAANGATVVTGAAPAAGSSGGAPFAEGAAAFLGADEQRGGRAGLQRKG